MTLPDPDDLPFAADTPDEPLDDTLRALIAQADAHPTLRPSRDLWPGIAGRLDALPSASVRPAAGDSPASTPNPAAPIGGARVLAFRASPLEHERGRRVRPSWLAAAAVALVTISSGVTYLATHRPDTPRGAVVAQLEPPARAGATDVATPTVGASAPAPPARSATAPESALATTAPDRDTGSADAVPARLAVQTSAPGRSAGRPGLRAVDRTVPGATAYDREIADLRTIVADRHGELDSTTVDVLARNLRIIDAAIAASRAALARDPHSPFLGEQLTRALGQKVELLRTAALLPRT